MLTVLKVTDGVGGADHLLEHLRIRSVEFAISRADKPGFDDRDARHRLTIGC